MSYRTPENLAAIKLGKMARNRLDKYLAKLKFGDSHDQIETYDVSRVPYMRIYTSV